MTEELTLLKSVHGEAKSLDGIGKRFFGSRLHEDLGEKLLAISAVELNFYKRILLFETRDHRLGFFEIHRGIKDHFAFLLCPFNQLLSARRCGELRRLKNENHTEQEKQRIENRIYC